MSESHLESNSSPYGERKASNLSDSHKKNGTLRKNSDPFSDWEAYRYRKSKIEISVGNPLLKEELFTKYFVYKIQGTDLKGYFEVSRRYSDFEKIRQLLVAQWPGCFIPSLPPRQINNMGKDVVEDRKKHLDNFCKEIARIPHLHYADVYQVFLRTQMVDLDPKIKYEDIIERYTRVFGHLSEKEIGGEAICKILGFGTFLQKAKGYFDKYKKVAKKFVVAQKEFTISLVEMHTMMSDDFEKNILAEYKERKDGKNVFFSGLNPKTSKSIEKIKFLQNQEAAEKLYEWIKAEGSDIEAFCEAFAQKEKIEGTKSKAENKQKLENKDLQNLTLGKTTLKTLFTQKNKKEQKISRLEDKVSNAAKEMENLSLVHELITLVLAYEEIDKFKAHRLEKYNQIMNETAANGVKTFNAVLEYWGSLLENINSKNLAIQAPTFKLN